MILLEAFSKVITRWTGSTGGFGCAPGVLVVWARVEYSYG
jgi:hypothetical protein